MRLLFVVVAGAIGWLWFAVRAPAAAPPKPAVVARHADLSGLGAQVAAAKRAVVPAYIEREVETADVPALEDVEEAVEEENEAEADAEERALLARFDQPPPRDAIDLSNHLDLGEVILIESAAPIIDVTTSSCGIVIDVEYTKNIPVPSRTFEGALNDASGYHDHEPAIDQPAVDIPADQASVSISSGSQIENEYIVEEFLPE